jgi:SAM-dependent methyltransferase
MDPLPSPEEIAAFYPNVYYGTTGRKFKRYVEWAVRFVAARHVRFLARRVPPGGRVLDVGCGRGTLLAALADRGLEAHGMEISRAAVEGADSRAQIRIATDLSEAEYPADHFDLVILWHVFEHLRDPRRVLLEVRAELLELAGAVGRGGVVSSRSAAPLVSLSRGDVEDPAAIGRVRAALGASLLAPAEPVRLGAELAEPFVALATERAV